MAAGTGPDRLDPGCSGGGPAASLGRSGGGHDGPLETLCPPSASSKRTSVRLSRRPASLPALLWMSFHVPTKVPTDMKCARRAHPHVAERLGLTLGHLHPPPPPLSLPAPGLHPHGSGPRSPLRQHRQDPSRLAQVLVHLLPLDVQQHEYSYFLFKTNLEFSLSKGLLITKNRLRQELIDRPTWPLLKNKLAIGGATYKGKCQGLVFMSY